MQNHTKSFMYRVFHGVMVSNNVIKVGEEYYEKLC